MQFDYSKLLGRIKEMGYTQGSLAEEIGTSESTMSLKLNNRAAFTQPDIWRLCRALAIPGHQIGVYFFTPKVQKN